MNSKYSRSIINSLTDKSTNSSINFLYLLSLKFIKPDNTINGNENNPDSRVR